VVVVVVGGGYPKLLDNIFVPSKKSSVPAGLLVRLSW
jgi:hypothetical protein